MTVEIPVTTAFTRGIIQELRHRVRGGEKYYCIGCELARRHVRDMLTFFRVEQDCAELDLLQQLSHTVGIPVISVIDSGVSTFYYKKSA